MKFEKIGITMARIHGVTGEPSYFEEKKLWKWNISFSDTTTIELFDKFPWIFLSEESEEDAKMECLKLKGYFKEAGIHEKEWVAVIFQEEDCSILAIAACDSGVWLDAMDKFIPKSFEELGINIKSLKVF